MPIYSNRLLSPSTPETACRTGPSGCLTARPREMSAAMGVVRRFAVAGLEVAVRRSSRRNGPVIGAVDETGQEKHGMAGGKRQYMGCAGKVANGINTVHLPYVREGTVHEEAN